MTVGAGLGEVRVPARHCVLSRERRSMAADARAVGAGEDGRLIVVAGEAIGLGVGAIEGKGWVLDRHGTPAVLPVTGGAGRRLLSDVCGACVLVVVEVTRRAPRLGRRRVARRGGAASDASDREQRHQAHLTH